MIRIIESPREGMQGFPRLLPAREKVRYINELLKVGFDVVEAGSLVSPKMVPQMADSLEVLEGLDLGKTKSGLMFLALNSRGAEILSAFEQITHISFPFSFSPAFLKLNLNSTPEKAIETADKLVNLCGKTGKQAVIYISMAFGNPYGEPWNIGTLVEWVGVLYEMGVRTIPLSNVSYEIDEKQILEVFSTLVPMFPGVEFGLHLHSANEGWYDKVNAAYLAGCRRFDGVINGLGGCPMAGNGLLGNLKTQNLVEFAVEKKIPLNIDKEALSRASAMAHEIFNPDKQWIVINQT
ncbi:MAG: hydroxymethylglutaryl-CoA lyase [Bacteroidota bacterium]